MQRKIRLLNLMEFNKDHLGNDLFINDPDRAGRIHEGAINGCDGSTHQERIDDWREFLSEYADSLGMLNRTKTFIELEIDDIEDWHQKNGSLNTVIG